MINTKEEQNQKKSDNEVQDGKEGKKCRTNQISIPKQRLKNQST